MGGVVIDGWIPSAPCLCYYFEIIFKFHCCIQGQTGEASIVADIFDPHIFMCGPVDAHNFSNWCHVFDCIPEVLHLDVCRGNCNRDCIIFLFDVNEHKV